ncbi:MAG TPA: 3'-5' exonuclease [Bacteroidia bacterium]|jgi:DNA polymerase-3 subunit epsilon|nr:3'-5' exonuclease [Bacteroidia bacterium]
MDFIKDLKLEKPIVFFDTETTGLDISSDRIISLSVFKFNVDGSREHKQVLINPTIPIKKEAYDVHGISDKDVENCPTFQKLAKSMYTFFEGCDVGGYNNSFFDNQLLQEEFARCGYDYPSPESVQSIDVCTIFKKFEKRDLSTAVKFYCGKEMEDAHNAEADNNATIEVFGAQLNKYEELKGKTVKELSDFCKQDNRVDWAGRIIRDENGDYVWNFGASKGQKIKDNKGFGEWILNKDFPESFKTLIRKILAELD